MTGSPSPLIRDSGDQSLPRHRRITRSKEIRETFSQQHRRVGACMVLWCRCGEGADRRLAVVASRKVGGSVDRSRARRRLREVFRRHRAELRSDMDVVLVARRRLLDAPWRAVEQEFLRLAARSGLMREAHPSDAGDAPVPCE